jgi:hypothetical protein
VTQHGAETSPVTAGGQSAKPGLKQKLAHELREMAWIFVFLAVFLCALATYSTLLLREFHISYFVYGTALLNALILSKIILLGEYFRLGRKHEGRPLINAAVFKALQFSVLMAVFHVLEEIIKNLIHGHTVASALQELVSGRLVEVLGRNLVFFCALVPFFVVRELRRVLGEHKASALFLHKGPSVLERE